MQFKGIRLPVKHSIIVNIREMFAKQERSGELVLLRLNGIDLQIHLVLLDVDILVPHVLHGLTVPDRVNCIREHKVLLIHQQIQQPLLQLMVLGPDIFFDGVLCLHVNPGDLGDGINEGVFVIRDQVLFGFKPFDIGI